MSEIRWTDSQRRATTTTGRGVVVSAGAGSGKTAVLAERCAYLVADAEPACDVDHLLVVTFTDAASAEMRERIAKALRRRLDVRPADRRVRRQLALIDTAAISTIHAFCKRTLDRHFAAAGLDPSTPLMDQHDARLMRRETIEAVFERLGEREDRPGEAFDRLVSSYSPIHERHLMDRVLAIDDFLSSLPDPDRWIADARRRFVAPDDGGLADPWRDLLFDRVKSELIEQRRLVRRQLDAWTAGPGCLGGHGSCLESFDEALADWQGRLGDTPDCGAIDDLGAALRGFKFPVIPRRSKTVDALPAAEQAAFLAAAEDLRRIRRANMAQDRLPALAAV